MGEIVEFEFVVGARRNCELVYTPTKKQLYKFKTQYTNKKGECIRRYICYQNNCKAFLQVINREVAISPKENNGHFDHGDQESLMKHFKLKAAIKEGVSKPSLVANKVRVVFNAECRNAKDSADQIVFNKMQRHLRRIKSQAMPKSPQTPQEFINLFANSEHMKQYGMCESAPDQPFYQTTILETDFSYTLFCSLPMTKLISTMDDDSRHYLVDATFAVVPSSGYKQLLLIYIGYERHVSC